MCCVLGIDRTRTLEGGEVIVTLFRSRLKPGVEEEYQLWARRLSELAVKQPGYISERTYVAQDGERLSITEFESPEAQMAWRHHPEHLMAQKKGRADFYLEYRIQVCRLERERCFHDSRV